MPKTLRSPFRNEPVVKSAVVDLASVDAGAIATSTVAVGPASLVKVGAVVDAAPPANFIASGLVFLSAYASADGVITLVVQNPTGLAVDAPSGSWNFTVPAA